MHRKTDQTGGMPRLIWVFAGFVGFVVQQLKYHLWLMEMISEKLHENPLFWPDDEVRTFREINNLDLNFILTATKLLII